MGRGGPQGAVVADGRPQRSAQLVGLRLDPLALGGAGLGHRGVGAEPAAGQQARGGRRPLLLGPLAGARRLREARERVTAPTVVPLGTVRGPAAFTFISCRRRPIIHRRGAAATGVPAVAGAGPRARSS